MGEERANIGSEEYALQREKLECEWDRCYGVLEGRYLALIEKEFCSQTLESREALRMLFVDAQFLQIFARRNTIMEMKFIMDIYEAELQEGIAHTILDTSMKSVEELRKYIRGLRFVIWRMQFTNEQNVDEEICEKIKTESISPIALLYVIKAATENASKILLHLADVFIDKHMFWHAYYILKELQKQLPEEREIQELLLGVERYL